MDAGLEFLLCLAGVLNFLFGSYGVSVTSESEPLFDTPVVNVTVKEGATAVLPCSVRHLGAHQVVWTDQWSTLLTYEDRRIIDDERISVERPYTKDWNLHIRSVRYGDKGVYNCQINTSPVKIKTVNLFVEVPARIVTDLSSSDITAVEGETVTLVCNVTGVPLPSVTWYRHKPHEDGLKEQIGMSGEVLIIHNVSRYCGDTYECVAYNEVPPAVNRLIRVTVQFPPEVRMPTKRIGHLVGKETILECIISASPHEISVWIRNGKELTNSEKYRIEIYHDEDDTITLSLRIRNLDELDFGHYTCMASNLLGQDEETMVLYDYSKIVKTPPTDIETTTTYIPYTPYPVLKTPDQEGRTELQFVTISQTTRPVTTYIDFGRGYPHRPMPGQKSTSGVVQIFASSFTTMLVFIPRWCL